MVGHMGAPEELMLQDLQDRYADVETKPAFTRLYPGDAIGSNVCELASAPK